MYIMVEFQEGRPPRGNTSATSLLFRETHVVDQLPVVGMSISDRNGKPTNASSMARTVL